MRAIDADTLEKDGWMMHRTVRVDKDTMSYQTKKPTDFPTIEQSETATEKILKSRWITTRNNHGRLETVFRGGLSEILEEIKGRTE